MAFIYRFLKEYDAYNNKTIRKYISSEVFKNELKRVEKTDIKSYHYSILNIINKSCGWESSKEGRTYYERLHALIRTFAYKTNFVPHDELYDMVHRSLGWFTESNFETEWFKEYCKVFGFDKETYPPYH